MHKKQNSKLHQLKDQIVIKFNENIEDTIIELLPPFDKPQIYKYVYQLKGIHSPCVHDAVPELHTSIKVEKFDEGKKVRFACHTNREARIARDSINTLLGEYGYHAKVQENLVIFETSLDTSAIPFLSSLGLNVLYCEHLGSNETIIFADKDDQKPINLFSLLHKKEVDVREKYEKDITLPKNIKQILTNVYLPDVKHYSPKFLSFIIETSPTMAQLSTYITLYHLADLGIPFPYVDKKSLIQIINKYAGVSLHTLKNQFNNVKPIHKRIASLYSFAELDLVFHNSSIDNNVKDQEDAYDDFHEEIIQHFTKKVKQKETRIRLKNLANVFKRFD